MLADDEVTLGGKDRNELTRAVSTWIEENSGRLVELVQALVRLDTRSLTLTADGRATNDEGECQRLIAERLNRLGCEVHSIEPDPDRFLDHPMMPRGHHWRGRAMTVARLPGTGNDPGIRSLAFNGHIDVVDIGDRSQWTLDPFGAELSEGRIHGRGTTDMKGGLGAAIFAIEAIRANSISLESDLWLQAVTDEETSGMGTVAISELAQRPTAAVFPEPTGFQVITSCRGVRFAELRIPGRPAHAELPQPDWREGGGVNPITRLGLVLEAIEKLNERWGRKRHELLSAPSVIPTMIKGGDFAASLPASVAVTLDITYLPADADESGFGANVRVEVEDAIGDVAAADSWLSAQGLAWNWLADYPPYEAGDLGEVLVVLEHAVEQVGVADLAVVGTDSWHDAATLGRVAGIPAFSFGPGEDHLAHAIDESIAIDDLIGGAKALASFAISYCGASRA